MKREKKLFYVKEIFIKTNNYLKHLKDSYYYI